jgi:DNA-binding NtrC family response regulator
MRRPWPGNVRELAGYIERAVVFGVDEMVDSRTTESDPGTDAPLSWPFPSGMPWTLGKLSRAYTQWVLGEVSGEGGRRPAIRQRRTERGLRKREAKAPI